MSKEQGKKGGNKDESDEELPYSIINTTESGSMGGVPGHNGSEMELSDGDPWEAQMGLIYMGHGEWTSGEDSQHKQQDGVQVAQEAD